MTINPSIVNLDKYRQHNAPAAHPESPKILPLRASHEELTEWLQILRNEARGDELQANRKLKLAQRDQKAAQERMDSQTTLAARSLKVGALMAGGAVVALSTGFLATAFVAAASVGAIVGGVGFLRVRFNKSKATRDMATAAIMHNQLKRQNAQDSADTYIQELNLKVHPLPAPKFGT